MSCSEDRRDQCLNFCRTGQDRNDFFNHLQVCFECQRIVQSVAAYSIIVQRAGVVVATNSQCDKNDCSCDGRISSSDGNSIIVSFPKAAEQLFALEEKVDRAIELILEGGMSVGQDRKMWVIDQILRILTEDEEEYQTLLDTQEDWDTGIPP